MPDPKKLKTTNTRFSPFWKIIDEDRASKTKIPLKAPGMLISDSEGEFPEENSFSKVKTNDRRKTRATTGLPINPNRDRLDSSYNANLLADVVRGAKKNMLDPYTMAAIAIAETNLGKSDDNIGHTLHNQNQTSPFHRNYDPIQNMMDAYKKQQRLAKGDTEAARIQAYNGYGKITPKTEANYHGFDMQSIYGVPIPKEGLNMKTNPLYGKNIIDIRDNVLKNSPEIKNLVDTTRVRDIPYRFDRGGRIKYAPGGKIEPYVTNDPNDPRIQAYRDSSDLSRMLYSNMLKADSIFNYASQQQTNNLPDNRAVPNLYENDIRLGEGKGAISGKSTAKRNIPGYYHPEDLDVPINNLTKLNGVPPEINGLPYRKQGSFFQRTFGLQHSPPLSTPPKQQVILNKPQSKPLEQLPVKRLKAKPISKVNKPVTKSVEKSVPQVTPEAQTQINTGGSTPVTLGMSSPDSTTGKRLYRYGNKDITEQEFNRYKTLGQHKIVEYGTGGRIKYDGGGETLTNPGFDTGIQQNDNTWSIVPNQVQQNQQVFNARQDQQQTYLAPDTNIYTDKQKVEQRNYNKFDEKRDAVGNEARNFGMDPMLPINDPKEFVKQVALAAVFNEIPVGKLLKPVQKALGTSEGLLANTDKTSKIQNVLNTGKKLFNKETLDNAKTYLKGKNPEVDATAIDYMKKWHESPEVINRINRYSDRNDQLQYAKAMRNELPSVDDFRYNGALPERKLINDRLNKFQDKSYRDLLNEHPKDFFQDYGSTNGLSFGTPDQIYSKRFTLNNVINPAKRESVVSHELSHLTDQNGIQLGMAEREDLLNPFGLTEETRKEAISKITNKKEREKFEYYTNPTEIRARMNQGRFLYNHNAKNVFTQEMTDHLIKHNFYGMGKYIKDPKAMKNLMNTMWQTIPATGIGAVGVSQLQNEKHDNGGKINSTWSIIK
tara:strand:+ start:190 stop:3006 length:2817 start_codon:yes stop_codon:yes gene_type:complete